jgi:hypothetical protein
MIAGELLLHVPGCEDGEPPFSQEMIGGGKVNHSFLVRDVPANLEMHCRVDDSP